MSICKQCIIKLTSSYVEPVGIIWCLLFKGARLDEVHPIRDLELSRSFQMRRISFNERFSAESDCKVDSHKSRNSHKE